jgi:phosphoglycerol transferase MdoB-like AlkP superfamily enzyme
MNEATPLESLFDKSEKYYKTTVDLLKLKTIDKSAEVFSFLVAQAVIFMVVALFLLIINIGFALWIGELIGKSYYGFFVIAALYGVIGALLYIFQYQLIRVPVRNSIISQIMQSENNEK